MSENVEARDLCSVAVYIEYNVVEFNLGNMYEIC